MEINVRLSFSHTHYYWYTCRLVVMLYDTENIGGVINAYDKNNIYWGMGGEGGVIEFRSCLLRVCFALPLFRSFVALTNKCMYVVYTWYTLLYFNTTSNA